MRKINHSFLFCALSVLMACLGMRNGLTQTLSFDHITIDEGLVHNNVNAITTDKDGFVWFGTRDGLCRWDGYEFRIYQKSESDPNSLPDNRIECLYLDRRGDLWIGTYGGGGLTVFRRESQRFVRNPVETGLAYWDDVAVSSIYQDSYGDFWFGTVESGVLRVDSALQNPVMFNTASDNPSRQLTGEFCFSFAEDENGDIWLGVSGNYVNRYDRSEDTIIILHPPDTEEEMYSYRKSLSVIDNTLWIGTEGNGLFVYSVADQKFVRNALENTLIRDVAVTSGGTMFIASDGQGLFVTEDSGLSFQNIRYSPVQPRSLSTNALYDLYIDESDNLWVGTFNGGANLYSPGEANFNAHMLYPSVFQNSGDQSVISFGGRSDTTVWVGLDGGGLWSFDITDGTFVSLTEMYPGIELSSGVITSIYHASNGVLWAGTFANGLNRIDLATGNNTIYRALPNLTSGILNNNIWDLAEGPDGSVWIATLGGGLHKYDPATATFDHFLPTDGPGSISDRNTRVLLSDRSGKVWIGTERGGLNLLVPGQRTFRTWTVGDGSGLRSNFITCIYEDRDGNIWVGTEGGGLHRMLPDLSGLENYSSEDGLPSDLISSVEQDRQGIIWISTSRGLASFDQSDGTVVRYNTVDGLASNQFNPNASISLYEGKLLFGNIRGMNSFDPEEIQENSGHPHVVLTDFRLFGASVPVGEFEGRVVFDKPINEQEEITLEYYDNSFTIVFAAQAYSNPMKYQYAYRLTGFDDEWIFTDAGSRSATYTNLDAGKYEFEVKTTGSPGEWSDDVTSFTINVLPAFWEMWWFRLMVVAVVLAGILFYIRYLDWIRKTEHEKELSRVEQEVLQLKNDQLEAEVQLKNSKLSAALLQTAHKNKALEVLGDQLQEFSQREPLEDGGREVRQLVRKIGAEVDSIDYWEQFQLNFNQIHQDFSKKLMDAHPYLTQNDVRLCCLIHINLTNSEIASIQNISKSGVEKSKYRLKQKLELAQSEDLGRYLQQFG